MNNQNFDVNESSLKKRWFGFTDLNATTALSAILVNYNVEHYPAVTAHIYDSNETITGTFDEVHRLISDTMRDVHKEMNGEDAPKPKGSGADLVNYQFMTQSFQGEIRTRASGPLFFRNVTQK